MTSGTAGTGPDARDLERQLTERLEWRATRLPVAPGSVEPVLARSRARRRRRRLLSSAGLVTALVTALAAATQVAVHVVT